MFKLGASVKGIILPLCQSGDCTLKEAYIFSSLLQKCSFNVDHVWWCITRRNTPNVRTSSATSSSTRATSKAAWPPGWTRDVPSIRSRTRHAPPGGHLHVRSVGDPRPQLWLPRTHQGAVRKNRKHRWRHQRCDLDHVVTISSSSGSSNSSSSSSNSSSIRRICSSQWSSSCLFVASSSSVHESVATSLLRAHESWARPRESDAWFVTRASPPPLCSGWPLRNEQKLSCLWFAVSRC